MRIRAWADFNTVSTWVYSCVASAVVVYCQDGGEISRGTAAWIRQAGGEAQTLQGGFEAWQSARQPLLCTDKLPNRDTAGRTTWVTRARPKVTRIACPWLIRRFVDPKAVILFVPPSDVSAVAGRFSATPFDRGKVSGATARTLAHSTLCSRNLAFERSR